MIKENQKIFNFLNVLMDISIIYVSYVISYVLRTNSIFLPYRKSLSYRSYMKYCYLLIVIMSFCYYIFSIYTSNRLISMADEIIKIIKSNITGAFLFLSFLFIKKDVDFSRYFIVIFVFTNTSLTSFSRIILRSFLRRIRKKGFNTKNAVMIGTSDTAIDFIEMTMQNPHWGYRIIKIFEKKENEDRKNIKNIEILPYEKIKSFLSENKVDEIIIGIRLKDYKNLDEIAGIGDRLGIKTKIIPDYQKYLPAVPTIEQVGNITIIDTRYVPLEKPLNKFIKRVLDIIFSVIIIILTLPVMIITAICIKLDSSGKIIYRQKRVGYMKKNFYMYKFRSMREECSKEKNGWTVKDDDRVTKVGRFIRRTNIDELPQLFNVLKGEMSLIGPRPERPFFVDQFKDQIPKYMIKHLVRPGMTGLAQCYGLRGDTSIKKRIQYDIFYIENWSLMMDFKIILLTLKNGFKNAY